MQLRGKSYSDISRFLQKNYGFKAKPDDISKWIDKRTDAMKGRLMARPEYITQLERQYAEVLEEFQHLFKFTTDVTEDMWDHAKQSDKLDDKVKVLSGIREMRALIELANSLMGNLPSNKTAVPDMAKSIQGAMKVLKQQGALEKLEKQKDKNTKDLTIKVPGCDEPVVIKKKIGID